LVAITTQDECSGSDGSVIETITDSTGGNAGGLIGLGTGNSNTSPEDEGEVGSEVDLEAGDSCTDTPIDTVIEVNGTQYRCSAHGWRTYSSRRWVEELKVDETPICGYTTGQTDSVNGSCPNNGNLIYESVCESTNGCYCPGLERYISENDECIYYGEDHSSGDPVITTNGQFEYEALLAISENESCPSGQDCWCESSPSDTLSSGDVCAEDTSSEDSDPATPTPSPVETPPSGTPEPTGTPTPESYLRGLFRDIFAQSSITISPQNGVFSVEASGIYCTQYSGEKYCFDLHEGGENRLYIDANNSNSFDKGDIDLGEDTVKLSLSLEVKSTSIHISKGFNLVSFDLVSSDIGTTAKEWLSYLNDRHDDAFYSIAKFDGGKWVVIENRDGETYGTDDFQIVPGQGYLLKSKYDMVLDFVGKAILDPVPVDLRQGWNLIGIQGGDTAYTAESLIDDVNSVDGLVSDNVTRWDTSVSRYIGLQKETSAVYGIDFPLSSLEGYFVRVKEGSGVWTPQ
jgi:hypothetical protein